MRAWSMYAGRALLAAELSDTPPADQNSPNDSFAHGDLRQRQWGAAEGLLLATAATRRRFDHRAPRARLVGIYTPAPEAGADRVPEPEVVIAVQPDRGANGRKLLFLDAHNDGELLGHVCIEVPRSQEGEGSEAAAAISSLRGMLVAEKARNRGLSALFLHVWLTLCREAGLAPRTSRINKPLLALTLARFGFVPDAPPGSRAARRSVAVEVSAGAGGQVVLHCPGDPGGGGGTAERRAARVAEGFSATELRSQRLVIAYRPAEPRGRLVVLRAPYSLPAGGAGALGGSAAYRGSELRLSAATRGVPDHGLSPAVRSEVLRILMGRV